MVKIISYTLFLLAVGACGWFIHRGILSSRYEKEERYFHCRYLAAYLLMLAIGFNRYTFAGILTLVSKLINLKGLEVFWNLVLPMRQYQLVYLVLSFLLTNLLFILLTVILLELVKFLFRRKMDYVDARNLSFSEKLRHLPWVVTAWCYHEDEKEGGWRVTDQGFTMSIWAGRMKYVFVLWGVIEVLLLSAGIFLDIQAVAERLPFVAKGWYLLPAAGYLLLEQIQYYLEGEITYHAASFGMEDIEEHLEGNMRALLYIYQEEFGGSEALLETYDGETVNVFRDGLMHNGLNQNQISECRQPEILSMINHQLKETGVVQNASFQNALSSLLNGNSVNIRDYIQGEFMIYLAAYLNYYASQEKTALILCGSEATARRIQEELSEALGRINKVYSIWKIADITKADSNEEMDILICSYQDFASHRVLEKRQDFFRLLQCVVLADGIEFCAQGNTQKELVFAEFNKIRHKIQYILISETDSDTLRNAFEYYTKQEMIPYKNDPPRNNTYIMIWKEDSKNKIQRALGIGHEQSPYMGVSIPLALVAAKYDLPRIHIFAGGQKGHYTYRDAMNMNSQEVLRYLGYNLDLEKMIRFNRFSVNDRTELELLILYDKEFNFYNLLRAWLKYGGKEATMIHIVSPVYMLREYFAFNIQEMMLKNNDFDALISYRSSLQHSRFLTLLLELCNAGVDEEELLEKNREYKWGYGNAQEILEACLRDVLKMQEFYNIYECCKFEEYSFFDNSINSYVTRTRISITDETIRRRIQDHLSYAHLVTKGGVSEELPILKRNICNYYLKGQIVPINGFLERIETISDGTIFAEQTVAADKKEYFQTSEFLFSHLKKVDECVDLDILDFNLMTADVERRIYGYWAASGEPAFQVPGAMRLYSICDSGRRPVQVSEKEVQILQIRMKRERFGENAEKAGLLAAFMFREIFKTLFPENYQNLYAVVEHDPGTQYWEELLSQSQNVDLEGKVRSIVPFVRPDDEMWKAGHDFVSIYIVEFSALEMGMVSSLYANRVKLFQIVKSYLEWYLREDGAGQSTEESAEEHTEESTEESARENTEAGEKSAPGEGTTEDGENSTGEQTAERANQAADQDKTEEEPQKKGVYLNLGGEEIASCFAAKELLEFCRAILPAFKEPQRRGLPYLGVGSEHYCSFCGKPALFTYHMADNRRMCRSCKQQQLSQREEIRDLYFETVEFLCKSYHIKLRRSINLRLKSADAIRRKCQVAPNVRILGFYQNRTHELWIESRGPRNAVQDTMIHELTHAWQYDNINVRKLRKKHPKETLELLEGHSTYMEVDAMRKLGEEEYARYLDWSLMQRDDEYGRGYRMMKDYFQNEENIENKSVYEAFKELIERLCK